MRKKALSLLLALSMVCSFVVMPAAAADTQEAVYLGVENFVELNTKTTPEENFVHKFYVDGAVKSYTVASGEAEDFAIQNQLMEGYIYNITVDNDVVTAVDLQDKGDITMGKITAVADGKITVGETEVATAGKDVLAIVTATGGAAVTAGDLAVGDTVKVTANAIYEAFVAEDYTPPVAGTPGQKTLKNFLTTALMPAGTALYVYGGGWDWEDDASSPQSQTIGIPQSWIDFFQANDTTYHYKQKDANGSHANSFYTSNRGWNQYYYAGIDCSAYVAWVVYNTLNTESDQGGFVGSSTNMAYNFAQKEGWGSYSRGTQKLNSDGSVYTDGDGDGRRYFNSEEFKVGDIFSDNGHTWLVLGRCEDGSMVILHSTPSNSADGKGEGGGIQLAPLDPSGNTESQATQLCEYYNAKYYPVWNQRYGTSQKSWSSYTEVYDTAYEGAANYKATKAGKFSWNLTDGVIADPDGYANMTADAILAAIFNDDNFEYLQKGEAVYLGVKDFTTLDTDNIAEDDFVHLFAINGQVEEFTIATGKDELYAIQNQLMEGYIYDMTYHYGLVEAVELQDKGDIPMGKITAMADGKITVDGKEIDVTGKPVYEITTATGGAAVAPATLAVGNTVKVTDTAVYKAFVAEEYTAPVDGVPGVKTLRNFLATALEPVGTALYVYGGAWDWQDDVSSNQSMTIGIAQSWIDFFQSHDASYHYKQTDANDSFANSYYTSNRGWNQYYYAGVDCSAYIGWVAYNVQNTEDGIVGQDTGYVGSSTKQAKTFAGHGWGTWTRDLDMKVGDVFSMSGHCYIHLGTCADGSMVFMHSTPNTSNGAGIQISAYGPDKNCEAYKLASYYMETYYPEWGERYDTLLMLPTSTYYQIASNANAGKMSWDLSGNGLLTDPDGFADMTPAEILANLFGEKDSAAAFQGVYLGIEDFAEKNKDHESTFIHKFFADGKVHTLMVDSDENFSIQNQLMEGYIYNVTLTNGTVSAVELVDKGDIPMGTVSDVSLNSIKLDGKVIFTEDKPVYEITTAPGGATVAPATLAKGDTVKITDTAIYKAFVAEEYTAPVDGVAGLKTLKNFLATALEPVGTALYVYGGAWDWQDDYSSNQSMTIGIPQSWIDFFQSHDASYHYKQTDASGSFVNSYYTSNRGWNQYYYAGVDCSAYIGWVAYNVQNTEDGVVGQDTGYVGSSTKQAKTFAANGWGTYVRDVDFKVGDVFSMSGHCYIHLGTCADGSMVFMHSTPNTNNGAGIQISAVGESKDCEAYKLASYYMETYYPEWGERYDALLMSPTGSYNQIASNANAGRFSWDLSGDMLLTDPDGYADMTPAEILADLYPAIEKPSKPSGGSSSKDDTVVEEKLPFADVDADDWFFDAVDYAYDSGLMAGIAADTFAPDVYTTRAMVVQMLYNLEGKPAAKAADFDDVAANEWYAAAIGWAVDKGIASGYGEGSFGPMDVVTREQVAVMLKAYAALKGYNVTKADDLADFTDADAVSAWALDAIKWAVGSDVMSGMGNGKLAPAATATRAQIAAMFMNFEENVVK